MLNEILSPLQTRNLLLTSEKQEFYLGITLMLSLVHRKVIRDREKKLGGERGVSLDLTGKIRVWI